MTRVQRFPWFICSLLFAATALSFLDRQVLSMLAPRITSEFGISNTAYSHVLLAFQISYTVMFTLGGYLVDRLGTRRGLAFALALWSFACGAHAFVRGTVSLAAARFLLGLGEGACFPAVTKGAAEMAPPDKRSFAIGYANGGSALGAVLAPPLTAFLSLRFGWRGAFLGTGLMGLVWLAFWLSASKKSTESVVVAPRVPVDWSLLRKDTSLKYILIARFLFDPVFYFYMFWIPQFLSRERHLSISQIGSLVWIPFLVLGCSQVLGGRIADQLVSRGMKPMHSKLLLLTISALLTVSSWLAFCTPGAHAAIALMSVLLFAHGIWITNFLGLLGDLFPLHLIATVTGLTGTAGGVGGMISTLAVGFTVDHFSFGPVFAVSSVLYPLALIFLFSAVSSQVKRKNVPL